MANLRDAAQLSGLVTLNAFGPVDMSQNRDRLVVTEKLTTSRLRVFLLQLNREAITR